jgi:hypothetical protein
MTSRFFAAVSSASCAFALVLASPAARAQQAPSSANCPPGSWFCADTQEKPAAPPGQPVAPQRLEPLPGSEPPAPAPAPPPPQVIYQQSPPVVYQMPPPVVLYQPQPQPAPAPPPPVYRPAPTYEAPPPYYYRPRPADSVSRPREWGLNLRIEGAAMGHDAAKDSGMGGLGFGLRYKPVPVFGLEADVDFWGGRDYYGYQRQETAFALNALFFVNPKSHVQVYFLAGMGWSSATVNNDSSPYYTQSNYDYFGGQAGGGLEFRLGRHFALNADVRGFIRGRTDAGAQTSPEYVDPSTRRVTNTSAGAIVTGGMTFYF